MASSLSSSTTPTAVSGAGAVAHFRNPAATLSSVSFRFSPKIHIPVFTKGSQPSWKSSVVVKAQLNEVSVDESSNVAPTPPTPSKPDASEIEAKSSNEFSPPTLATEEESIAEFINQVASLIKLVDSRDIVELELKQNDCELLIRKKEAMPQPPAPTPAPFAMMHAPPPQPVTPDASATSSPVPVKSAPAAPKPPASSHPPFKCPMAGTFYRCPGPGEPPFVKVGDKVKKGQVVCIIEAMKLMNEIEADQSGTLVDILVEDGKPVSVDMPLFLIEP